MAFVVPAEIGHAPYASPVLNFLCSQFQQVRIVAIREKLFPNLSEGAWLLFADGFGRHTDFIEFSLFDRFSSFAWTHQPTRRVSISSWRDAGCRLRKFLLPEEALVTYQSNSSKPGVNRLGEIANIGIGYVSGANDFFHLRPSEVKRYGIPGGFLRISIRRSRQLPTECVDRQTVKRWISLDEPIMLLDLSGAQEIPPAIISYLNSEQGREVRKGYKCRNRDPWYAIPDVRVPDAFLSYMSGAKPAFVRNDAECVCTNSVHAVFMKAPVSLSAIQGVWSHPLVDLSCELEGHPLGGGMLKMEPREASNVLIPLAPPKFEASELRILKESTAEMRGWRDYA